MDIKKLFNNSLILSSVEKLTNSVSKAIKNSMIGGFFTSANTIDKKKTESLASSVFDRLQVERKVVRPAKRAIIRSIESSKILTAIKKHLSRLLGYPLKYYGVLLLTFGIFSLITFGARYYINSTADISHFTSAATLMFISLPLLLTSQCLNEALQGSVIAPFLLFKVVGLRQESLNECINTNPKNLVAFIFGALLGILTIALSPVLIIVSVFALLILYIILCVPEFGVILILFLLPFMGILPHPSILTALMLLYVAGCTALKIVRGKRAVHLEICDHSVWVFMLLTLLGGLVSVSRSASMSYALIYACLMLGYFIVVVLIRTEQWFNRCIAALLSSSTIVAIIGIYQHYSGTALTIWQDSDMFENTGRITSTFDNPNVLAEYLIMCLPLIVALFVYKSGWLSKISSGVMIALVGLALVYTMSRGAWLGGIIGLLIFLVIISKRALAICILGVLCVPLLPFVLPDNIIRRFTSIGNLADSSTAYRVNIWKGCIKMFADHFKSGIGVGKDAFALVYPSYSLAGIESAPHSHNLYLQIGIELGIIGLVAFLCVILLMVIYNFTFYVNEKQMYKPARKYKLYSAAALCGVMAVLAQGMTDYVWYNYRIFLLFWLLLGLASASRKIARKEYSHSLDDMQL